MYGKTDSFTSGAWYLELDGQPSQMQLNGTTFSDGVAPIYHVRDMGDDDHQLTGIITSLTKGTFLMDYFECGCPCSTPSQTKYANNLAAFRIENASANRYTLLVKFIKILTERLPRESRETG